MKAAGQIILRAAARFYLPIIALFAVAVFAADAGARGFLAGLVLALAFALHLIVAGVGAARRAAPAFVLRACLALGLVASLAPVAAPRWTHAALAGQCGLFLLAAAGVGLALIVLAGRAPTLRDEEW